MSISGNSFLNFILEHWESLLITILLIASFACLLSSFLVFNHKQRRFENAMLDSSNSLRIYVVDLKNGSVYYYSNKDLKTRHHFSLESFLNQYRSKDQSKLRHWLIDLADGKEGVPLSLEVSFVSRHYHTSYVSMLDCYSIDPSKKKLYLESRLFKALHSNEQSKVQSLSLSEAEAVLANASPKRGVCFCFRFSYKRESMQGEHFDNLNFNQIKDIIYRQLPKKNCYLIELSDSEIAVFNLKIRDKSEGARVSFLILEDVNRFLSVNSLSDLIDVRVGAIEHRYFPNAAKAILAEAEKAAGLAYELGVSSYWYDESHSGESAKDDFDYQSEIESIIENDRISFYYRPIYSVDRSRTVGYFSEAIPESSHFATMKELKHYADKSGETRILLAHIIKNLVPTFLTQKEHDSDTLYLSLTLAELPFLFLALSKVSTNTALPLCFVFKDEEIKDYTINKTVEDFLETMNPIKKAGYRVALRLSESGLILPEAYYGHFDAFIVSFSSSASVSSIDAKIRSELHALVEKTLRFKKPIIATDIEGWNAIELLIRSGLQFLSSQSIAPYETMILPLTDKSKRRLKEMKGN